MTLTEFLLQRIAEDEARATRHHTLLCARTDLTWENDEHGTQTEPYPCNCGYPERVLAECAAKRAIVERYEHAGASMAQYPNAGNGMALGALTDVLRHLAAVHADNPYYRDEWKP